VGLLEEQSTVNEVSDQDANGTKEIAPFFIESISFVGFLAAVAILILIVLYINWLLRMPYVSVGLTVAPTAACLGMCLVIIKCTCVLEKYWGLTQTSLANGHPWRAYLGIAMFFTMFTAIMLSAIWSKYNDNSLVNALMEFYGGSQSDPYYFGGNIDIPHYFNIARFGYVNEGTALDYNIVFFPMYPLLLYIGFIIYPNFVIVGMTISTIASVGSCAILYKLERERCGHEEGIRTVKYLVLFPMAYYLFTPMSESLFLLLSLSVFYCLTHRQYILLFIFALCAGLTRSIGIVITVPILIEAGRILFFERDKITAVKTAICACAPLLSLSIYMLINYIVFGNPLIFLEIQQTHWSQSISFFWNTAHYLTEYSYNYIQSGDIGSLMGYSGSGVVSLAMALALIIVGSKRLPPTYTAYATAYFVMGFGATWLLSGPRYTLCLFPIAMSMSWLTRNKWVDRILTGIYVTWLIIYTHYYITGVWDIY